MVVDAVDVNAHWSWPWPCCVCIMPGYAKYMVQTI